MKNKSLDHKLEDYLEIKGSEYQNINRPVQCLNQNCIIKTKAKIQNPSKLCKANANMY